MFTKRQLVRFQHCDPAGMVFYPRYLDMAHATVEDWFSDRIGMSFADIHGDRRSSVPVVSLSMTFHAPSRLGGSHFLADDIGLSSAQFLIKSRFINKSHIKWPEKQATYIKGQSFRRKHHARTAENRP